MLRLLGREGMVAPTGGLSMNFSNILRKNRQVYWFGIHLLLSVREYSDKV
jgi:hypothetical protein